MESKGSKNENLIYSYSVLYNGKDISDTNFKKCFSYITFGDTVFVGPLDCYGFKPEYVDTTLSFSYPYIPKLINDTIFYLPIDSSVNKIPKFVLRADEYVYIPGIQDTDPFTNSRSATSFSYYIGDTIIKGQDKVIRQCWIFDTHDNLPRDLDIKYYIDKKTMLPVKIIKSYPIEKVRLEFTLTNVSTYLGLWPNFNYGLYYDSINK